MTIREQIKQVLQDTLKPLEQCGFVIKYLESKWGSEDSVELNISHQFQSDSIILSFDVPSVEDAQQIKPERVVEQYIDEAINYTVHY